MKKLSALALALAVIMILTSCIFTLPTPQPNDPGNPDGKDPITDSELKNDPEQWGNSSAITTKQIAVTVIKGTPTDIKSFLPQDFPKTNILWQSECDGIATVADGVVTGVKCGRTVITADDNNGVTVSFTVTVEFLIIENSGYEFNTITDETVYQVTSELQANKLIDIAIASHVSELSLDFSALGDSYVANRDFKIKTELGNHVSLGKKYYKSKPHLLHITIEYEKNAASKSIAQTSENTYSAVANGNAVIRMDKIENSEHKRPDDFEGFAINTNNAGTFKVYNSEELWWALEQNYKPEFAVANTKAELFYERAKMILRDIITEDMDELDKVIAITEYLTDAVAYDYDSYYMENRPEDDGTTNICYYLEGVFERGAAVCDGKSKAFVLFCRIEGIECVRDFGSDPLGGAGHAWNYVKLGTKWYMVDTTSTDNSSTGTSGVGQFLGKNVEFMVYNTFLEDVLYHAGTYTYSGLFKSITDTSAGATLTDEVFKNKIYNTVYDFHINTKSELRTVVGLMLETELCDEAIISFKVSPAISDSDIFDVINSAIRNADSPAKYNVFTFGEGDNMICVAVFKNI